jgi:hypothetical protein
MKRHPPETDDYSQLDKAEHIAGLVAGYVRKSLTHPEYNELDEWILLQDNNMVLFEEMTDEKKLQAELEMVENADITGARKKCIKKISFKK